MPKALWLPTWELIKETIENIITANLLLSNIDGNWKHMLFPLPVFCITITLLTLFIALIASGWNCFKEDRPNLVRYPFQRVFLLLNLFVFKWRSLPWYWIGSFEVMLSWLTVFRRKVDITHLDIVVLFFTHLGITSTMSLFSFCEDVSSDKLPSKTSSSEELISSKESKGRPREMNILWFNQFGVARAPVFRNCWLFSYSMILMMALPFQRRLSSMRCASIIRKLFCTKATVKQIGVHVYRATEGSFSARLRMAVSNNLSLLSASLHSWSVINSSRS